MSPTVTALDVQHARTTRTVTVLCPFCTRRHHHGWPYDSALIGVRLSHCRNPEQIGSYSIDPPAGYQLDHVPDVGNMG
ncbi:MAG: hypothetical protein WKF57_10260 [Nakamurella sp.]